MSACVDTTNTHKTDYLQFVSSLPSSQSALKSHTCSSDTQPPLTQANSSVRHGLEETPPRTHTKNKAHKHPLIELSNIQSSSYVRKTTGRHTHDTLSRKHKSLRCNKFRCLILICATEKTEGKPSDQTIHSPNGFYDCYPIHLRAFYLPG